MAHLYFIMRGSKMWSDAFINDLQGKYLPFKYKGEDKVLQLGVRPVQLWEIAYPKEHEALILSTILGEGMRPDPQYKKLDNIFGRSMRFAMGLKPIPEFPKGENAVRMPVCRQNLDIIGIGIKDDAQFEWGEGI